MVRSPSRMNQTTGLKKGPWTSEEDEILTNHISIHGHPNWRALPRLAGLARCGKSCRLRWTNYLQPGIKRGNFTREEEEIIITSHQLLGNRWSAIAAKLPGRTDNEIKNVWHTHLKKKLVLNKDDNIIQQSSSATTDQSSSSNNDDEEFIIVDESIFDLQVCDGHQVQHAQCDHQTENPNNDAHACPSFPLIRSFSDASYNNYKEVPSPEEFPETDENFWSDILSSDNEYYNNSSTGSIPPVLDENMINMDTNHSHMSSFSPNEANVSGHSSVVEDGGDVDDFWFDVLFRAGEHPAFLADMY